MIRSFLPVVDKNSKVLILGSMPGVDSLKKLQYYGHSRNSFWYIIFSLTHTEFSTDYNLRKKCLLKNRIAVWDVMKSCNRKGSLDSAIKKNSIITNNFKTFFEKYPLINNVFFNGATAQNEFNRKVLPEISGLFNHIKYHRLPSTSPAMAMMKREEKLVKWGLIIETLISF
ncbi:DNA-deoxyinosine glycosylase [bacterium]|nr:DNA-deoxyinosine glycosylase [bacterium]